MTRQPEGLEAGTVPRRAAPAAPLPAVAHAAAADPAAGARLGAPVPRAASAPAARSAGRASQGRQRLAVMQLLERPLGPDSRCLAPVNSG